MLNPKVRKLGKTRRIANFLRKHVLRNPIPYARIQPVMHGIGPVTGPIRRVMLGRAKETASALEKHFPVLESILERKEVQALPQDIRQHIERASGARNMMANALSEQFLAENADLKELRGRVNEGIRRIKERRTIIKPMSTKTKVIAGASGAGGLGLAVATGRKLGRHEERARLRGLSDMEQI
jgi:hypothetical protein